MTSTLQFYNQNLLFMKILKLVCLCAIMVLFYACSDDLDNQLIETNSQNYQNVVYRTCGMENHMHQLMQDPAQKTAMEKRLKRFETIHHSAETRALCSNPTVLPMAVHFQGVPSPNGSCLIELAESQIAILNNDYQGNNSDISNWINDAASIFPGVNYGEACIEFCLANKNHPSGYNLNDGDLAVTINETTGDFNSDWTGYINVFVQFDTGLLGYSPLGGSGNGDGVVIDANAFGTGSGCGQVTPNPPYNLGRTLTHELGHYLLLDHIWGNGCGTDDEVSDTPNANEPYYGCPNIGASSCGSTDMHMNYMDYVDDACMYMFSDGQASRMEDYTLANLSNVIDNASYVCDGSIGNGDDGDDGDGDEGTTCESPELFDVEVQNVTTVEIDWTDEPDAIKYKVAYRVMGTTVWTKVNVTPSVILLESLLENTTYQFRIKTRCPDSWTTWSEIQSFSTLGEDGGGDDSVCENPIELTISNIEETSVTITWDDVPNALKYRIRYRELGTTAWTNINTENSFLDISGLMSNTVYQFRIRTRCPESWTAWSAIDVFTTAGGGDDDSCTSVTFNLTLDDYGSETTWELISDTDEIVDAGGPYSDGSNGELLAEAFCLLDGCYTIYVDDAYGDGICCDYGEGSFEILDSDANQIGYSDGNFGNYDYIDFCVDNGTVNFKDQDNDEKFAGLAKKELKVD